MLFLLATHNRHTHKQAHLLYFLGLTFRISLTPDEVTPSTQNFFCGNMEGKR